MGAKLCIENRTNVRVAVQLEHVSIRYYAMIDPGRKFVWHPRKKYMDQGFYTLRAIDIDSVPGGYTEPKIKSERFKAVAASLLLALAGVSFGVLLPFIAPAIGVITANPITGCKQAVKHGAHVGRDAKYLRG